MSQEQSIESPRGSAACPLPEGVTITPLSRPFRLQKRSRLVPKCNRRQAQDLFSQQSLPIAIDNLLFCQSYYEASGARKWLSGLAVFAADVAVAVVLYILLGIWGFTNLILRIIACFVFAHLFVIALSVFAYRAFPRLFSAKGKTSELPPLEMSSFVAAENDSIYVFPLVEGATDFECDRVLTIGIGKTDLQLLKKGQQIRIGIVPGFPRLVLEIYLHEINGQDLAYWTVRGMLWKTARYFQKYSAHQRPNAKGNAG